MAHVKLWKRYIFYIISIQLLVFMMFSFNKYYLKNEEIVEEHLIDRRSHIASIGKKGNKMTNVDIVPGKYIGFIDFRKHF